MADKTAREWAPDYKLQSLCGDSGSLDGKCYEWVAFYTSNDKPGNKLLCSYYDIRTGKRFHRDEWNADWVWYDGTARDDIGIAPGPAWLHHEDDKIRAGNGFISTAVLCKPGNLNGMIAPAKRDVEGDLAAIATDYGGFNFVLDRDRWVIGIRTHGYVYRFYFDAKTGKYLQLETK